MEIGEPEETPPFESALEINEPESEEVALGLSENEIALDLDASSSIPTAPPVVAPLDEVELNLKIEDLGLELESSDDPEPDKP